MHFALWAITDRHVGSEIPLKHCYISLVSQPLIAVITVRHTAIEELQLLEMMESYLISDAYSFGVPTGSEISETATESL